MKTKPFLLAHYCLVAFGLSLCPDAFAHGELPFSRTVFLQEQTLIGGAANYGLIRVQNDTASWTAEDSIGSEPRLYHHVSNGTIFAAGFRGLYRTTNWGCSWEEIEFFNSQIITQVVSRSENAQHLTVITASRDLENGVFFSEDGGNTWQLMGNALAGISLKSMVASAEHLQWWIQGHRHEDWSVVVFRLSPQEQWEPVELDLEYYKRFTLLSAASTQAGGTRIVIGAQKWDDQAVLLETVDGLESTQLMGSTGSGAITHYAANDGVHFATTRSWDDKPTLWRSVGEEPFEAVDGPRSCIMTDSVGDFWGCGDIQSGGHFLKSRDGENWEVISPFGKACPKQCAEGTIGFEIQSSYAKDMQKYGVGIQCVQTSLVARSSDSERNAGCNAAAGYRGGLLFWGILCLFISRGRSSYKRFDRLFS